MEQIALLEAIDRDGMVRQAWRIERWPVSIGRALDNDVVLTDPHVAAHHATIDVDAPAVAAGAAADAVPETEAGTGASPPAEAAPVPPALIVRAGATRNGLTIARTRLPGGESRRIADSGRDLELQIGRTAMRLRLPGHALAPEQTLAPMVARDHRWGPTAALALALIGAVLFNSYLDTDPDNLARASGGAVIAALAGGAIWCGLWALLSKTFTRQSSFAWHVRVFVVASLAMLALSALPSLIAFAFSWPWTSDFAFLAVYATIAVAIHFHLLAVEPGRERLLRGVTATGFVVGVALAIWFNVQRTGRAGEELYMNHLFPPPVRLASPVPVERLIGKMAPLQAVLDQQAREPSGSDEARGDDDGD